MNNAHSNGKVWIVGAGPGAPGLLTLRAYKTIRTADFILFDHLVSEDIRRLFPQSVPAVYVGKRKGEHSIAQKDLNALLLKKAREGKRVCRLKGGDPFVFGRGGEELMFLLKAGIDAEVVPGVTAASGCSTYAGIPLTHRGMAQGCTFVTGHGERDLNLNWQALANIQHTLVFYMGLSRAGLITEQLVRHGMAGNTPAAIIENGCRDNQRVLLGRVDQLVQMISDNKILSPALIVVGDVVSLAEQFNPQVMAAQLAFDQQRLSA